MQNLNEIKDKIKECLEKLYERDAKLFGRNSNKGLCERCLVFRFGLYLQEAFPDYFVDCDFNSSVVGGQHVSQKPITNPNGTSTGRYIDIIIHKRGNRQDSDFICFEVKKWNNYDSNASEKDKNNLRVLTSQYGYLYGFYLILGKNKRGTKWDVFQNGNIIESMERIFET